MAKPTRVQRQKQAIDTIKESDIQISLAYFDNRCAYCNVKLIKETGYDNSLEIDHYRSLAEQDDEDEYQLLEGLTIQNALPVCRECNRKKYNNNAEEWIRSYFPNAEEVIYNIEYYFSLQGTNDV